MEKRFRVEIEVTITQDVDRIAENWGVPKSLVALKEENWNDLSEKLAVFAEIGYDPNRDSCSPNDLGISVSSKVISRKLI